MTSAPFRVPPTLGRSGGFFGLDVGDLSQSGRDQRCGYFLISECTVKDWELPEVLNTDKAPTYAAAIAELKAEGTCPKETRHRQVKYLNNVVEVDHGKLKQLIRPVCGFKTMKTAYSTIKGFEVMRALRKGQARAFALQGGIIVEARIVERAFGVGPCALTEAIALLQDHLANAES